ncbi:MAG: tRNA (adenosine(37)-N6)-dimethylallyltransferase MiaA [Rhodospirillaceae bacterium]|nr:tRNA (adenosine(37)-N6)-dimethylallyltransferase MiaA [Rhodospirillaceae bacterium]
MNKVVIVAGPTASGKSTLAIAIAEAFNGVVINADSMQIYDALPILTSRPSIDDENRTPHRLYGILSPLEICSAGRWSKLVVSTCKDEWCEDRLPIIVGGTGLYLSALIKGLSPIPDIPSDIRKSTRDRFRELGNVVFHSELAKFDPQMATKLHPSDSQRLIRAWDVLMATGRSLAQWQTELPVIPLSARFLIFVFFPQRDWLYSNCDYRLKTMIKNGVLREVQIFLDLNLNSDLPILRALGVEQFREHLNGKISLNDAITATQQATHQYIKRQITWFNNQLVADYIIDTQSSKSLEDVIFPNIRKFLLSGTS